MLKKSNVQLGGNYTTAFEKFFSELKQSLNNSNLYDVWPDFTPNYNPEEYFWSEIGNLGEVLILHCCNCDGPSDPRHPICEKCVEERKKIAEKDYVNTVGVDPPWKIVMLCRVYGYDE
ncbi:MAG: hypothetical protein ACTSPL_02860 [Candidatus Odinarchaeia archaeon]